MAPPRRGSTSPRTSSRATTADLFLSALNVGGAVAERKPLRYYLPEEQSSKEASRVRMAKPRPTYREYLEDRCWKLLERDQQFHDFPSPRAGAPPPLGSAEPLNVTIRAAQRGQLCSLCGVRIPMESQVDPDPTEYEWPSGSVMRFHGLLYSGAPDQRTSCLGVWRDVSKAWGKQPATARKPSRRQRRRRSRGRSQTRRGRR